MLNLTTLRTSLPTLVFALLGSGCAKQAPSPPLFDAGGEQREGTGGVTTDGSVPGGQDGDAAVAPTGDAGNVGPQIDAATKDAGNGSTCTVDCGSHGSCVNEGCLCEKGYQNATCDECAAGYIGSATDQCIEEKDAAIQCTTPEACPDDESIHILQWGTSFEDIVYAVSVAEDGELLLAGSTSREVGPPVANGRLKMVLMGSSDDLASVSWSFEWGTPFGDAAYAMKLANNGNVYVAGYTGGDLSIPNLGGSDVTVSTLNADYNLQRNVQWGTPQSERPRRLIVDPTGSVFVFGWTWGSFTDSTVDSFGVADVFVTKLSPDSTVEWTAQFGSAANEYAGGLVALETGDVIVVGTTEGRMYPEADSQGFDMFCARLSSTGEVTEIHQLSRLASDYAYDVALLPDGNLVISGKADGRILVTKRTTKCEEIWTTTLDTRAAANGFHVGVDAAGSIYVGGETRGNLIPGHHMGATDAFVAKFNADGQEVWIRQVGSTGSEFVMGMTVMPDGTVYLNGGAGAALPGQEFAGQLDYFVITFEPTTP